MFDVLDIRVVEFEPLSIVILDGGLEGNVDFVPTKGDHPVATYHILDENGNIITDENGNRITYI